MFCVHWYLHLYIHMYIHAYIHPYINNMLRTRVYTSVYQYGCIYIFEIFFFLVKLSFAFMKTSVHTRVYTCINIHVCIQIYVCIYGCIYTFFFFLGKRFVINFFTIFLGVWHMDFVKLIPFWGFLKTWAKDKLFV